MVEDHYAKLGFSVVEKGEDGTVLWKRDVASASSEGLPIPMAVERFGFDLVEAD
jgi:hypothetical protein